MVSTSVIESTKIKQKEHSRDIMSIFLHPQVVGYDSRRRMHRCLYDATGEKQWHDLTNKRFEVADQNGVGIVSRGTESAPPPPTSAPSLLLPSASPSKQ